MAEGQTPNSSPTSYLTVDEFIIFKDIRAIGQLAVDDGTEQTQLQLQTNQRIEAILLAASGEIESALLSSDRYFQSDLSRPNGASQQFLKKLVADLAIYMLYTARDGPEPPAGVLADYDNAQKKLEMLSSGERILSFVEVEVAGVADDVFMTAADFQNLNRFSDAQRRAIGIRQDMRRGNQGSQRYY